MMKTSELRIGNIVEWNKRLFKVCRIFDNEVENELWCKRINELHPIPIDKEWLCKLGFVKSENFIGLEITTGMFLSYRNSKLLMEAVNNIKLLRFDGVIYVHQLQNLFFALTNQELIIR